VGEVVVADRSLRKRCAALGVQIGIRDLDPGRRQAPGALLLSKAPQLRGRRVVGTRTAGSLQGVSQVGEKLQVLSGHHVPVGNRVEAGAVQIGGHLFAHVVQAGWVAAEVEQPGQRRGGDLDHSGLEVGSGHDHAHRLHVGEAAQGKTFVLDTVLGTDHRRPRGGTGLKVDEERLCVLGLGREHGHVPRSKAHLRRIRGGSDGKLDGPLGIAQLESLAGERREVCSPRHEHDVVAGFEKSPADDTADRAGTKNHVTHVKPFI